MLQSQNISTLQKYSLNEGLSQSVVNDIIQDDSGFLWIGTQDGLNRFDGYTFKVFSRRFDRSSGLKSGYISKLFIDSKKRFWIGTIDGGIHLFDADIENFQSILFKVNNDTTFNIVIQEIYEHNDVLYVGSKANGLFYYNETQNLFVQYSSERLTKINIRDMLVIENAFYFATSNGLVIYDLSTQKITQYSPTMNDKNSPNVGNLNRLLLDLNNNLWIGTVGFGLQVFNLETKTFHLLRSTQFDEALEQAFVNDLDLFKDEIYVSTDNALYSVNYVNRNNYTVNLIKANQDLEYLNVCYFDKAGNMWIGSWGNGIQKRRFNYDRFDYLGKFNNELVRFGSLFSLVENDHYLFVGSQGKGVFTYKKPEYSRIKINTDELENEDIYQLKIFGNYLFIGTYERGLFVYDIQKKSLSKFVNEPKNQNSVSSNIINDFVQENKDEYWIATSNGLNQLNLKTKKIKRYHHNIVDNIIKDKGTIKLLKQDTYLWIGTDGDGLLKFSIPDQTFTKFENNFNNQSTISDNIILSLHLDSEDILWIGTDGGGLNYFDTHNEDIGFKNLSMANGLPNNVIYGILEDDSENLWLSTNLGLSKVNRKSFDIKNFDIKDGLQSNEFNQNAYFKNSKGLMYFAGITGITSFYPEDIKSNQYNSNIIMTDVIVSGKSVFTDYKKNTLSFDYTDNVITFEFVNLDLTTPEKNKYSYKLIGFNDEWINLNKVHFATFTNLSPGDYEFIVRATNNDGVWNSNQLRYTFKIISPFWTKPWFIFIIVLSITALIYFISRIRIARITKRNEELEQTVSKRTKEIETKAHIISSINQNLDLEDLLKSILDEIGKINVSDRMSFLVYHKEDRRFKFENIVGFKADELKGIEYSIIDIENFYASYFSEVAPDCFALQSDLKADFERIVSFSLPTFMYAMMIRRNERIEAIMVLERFNQSNPFTDKEMIQLNGLKAHIELAFIKLRLLEELKLLNDNKNMFLGIVAHDLRNPLTKIAGYVSLLGEYIKEPDFDYRKVTKDVDLVLNTTDKMSSLIRDLLDYSAIESGNVNLKLETIHFNEVLDLNLEYFQRVAEKKNITVDIDYESFKKLPKMCIDKYKMSEVMDNLLSNAIKYTFENGRISIKASHNGNEAKIYVTDTGQGLSLEDQKEVFKTFKTLSSKPTGGETSTGLGLAIAKKIIDLHGGEIKLESELNKGSTFYFSLKLN